MRCITVMLAASVLATGTAWADQDGEEQPSREVSLAIRSIAGAVFADKHCPHVKLNETKVLSLLGAVQISPPDLYKRFGSYVTKFTIYIDGEYQKSPDDLFYFLLSNYGPGGAVPDLIEKF